MVVSDLLRMYATADVKKIVLSTLVAKNLKRIQDFQPSDTGLISLSAAVNTIQNRLAKLASQVASNAILDSYRVHLDKFEFSQFEHHVVLNGIKAESAGYGVSSGFSRNKLRVTFLEEKYNSSDRSSVGVKQDSLKKENISWSDVAKCEGDSQTVPKQDKTKMSKRVTGTKK